MASPINEEMMMQRRDELQSRFDELKQEQSGIQRELHAISLYLGALKGDVPASEPAPAPKTKTPRTSSGTRARKGERRGVILDILRQEPEGYTSDKIYELLGVTNSREQKAVYATLHNMKSKGQIAQNPNKHFVVPAFEEDEAEPTDEPIEADAG